MTVSMLNTALFQYNVKTNGFPKLVKHFHILQFMKSLRGGPFFAFSLPVGQRAPLPPPSVTPLPTVEKCRPPSHGLKQSQAFQDGIIS